MKTTQQFSRPLNNDLPGPRENCVFTLHPAQWQVFNSPTRFRVLAAGRRFGKTELAVAEIVRAAFAPNQVIWYVAPTNDQSKSIVWDRLKEMTQPLWAKSPSETHSRIDLINGSRIFLKGAFKPSSLRGHGLDFVVLDEFADFPATAWRQVFRPALADRRGRALFIGTPDGRNHFFDCFERGNAHDSHPEWQSFHFTTAQGGIVTPEELASTAEDLDVNSFRQEMEAEFGSVGLHRVYSSYDRHANIKPVAFDPLLPLIWSIDFNVDPMCSLLMQAYPNGIVHVLKEMCIRPNATTEQACRLFQDQARPYSTMVDFFHAPLQVKVYGDSSGRQRNTSSLTTDWAIIRESFNTCVGIFKPNVFTPNSNPAVRERVNTVNSRLRNQHGEYRLFIDPQCKELIRDLEEVSWVLDSNGNATNEIDKSDGRRTHMTDALGYFLAKDFPLRNNSPIGPQPHPLPLY